MLLHHLMSHVVLMPAAGLCVQRWLAVHMVRASLFVRPPCKSCMAQFTQGALQPLLACGEVLLATSSKAGIALHVRLLPCLLACRELLLASSHSRCCSCSNPAKVVS